MIPAANTQTDSNTAEGTTTDPSRRSSSGISSGSSPKNT